MVMWLENRACALDVLYKQLATSSLILSPLPSAGDPWQVCEAGGASLPVPRLRAGRLGMQRGRLSPCQEQILQIQIGSVCQHVAPAELHEENHSWHREARSWPGCARQGLAPAPAGVQHPAQLLQPRGCSSWWWAWWEGSGAEREIPWVSFQKKIFFFFCGCLDD